VTTVGSGIGISADEKNPRIVAQAIRQLQQGRSNAAGLVTLAINTTTTTVTATNCATGSVPLLTPMTAHASAEFGNGTIYISAVNNGSFVITHANNSQNDRTFRFFTPG
jgi:hypothetical protein